MKTNNSVYLVLAVSLISASCGDDSSTAGDARVDAPDIDAAVPKVYKQVEHLARPGINEALLLSNAFNAGYNATAPSFMGVPTDTLNMVVAEAKTVLKALYLGTCLLNGVVGVTNPDLGLKPAGIPCHALGGALWSDSTGGMADGQTLTGASMTAAQTYADRVFDQFVPDVMRVDMSVTPSSYETACAALDSKPVLCGGRFLDDDTIDTTYNYLLNGLGLTAGTGIPIPQGAAATNTQLSALVSDGVQFLPGAGNKNNRTPPNPTNGAQFHPPVSNNFPYSANPL
jgi:hypothetical protein